MYEGSLFGKNVTTIGQTSFGLGNSEGATKTSPEYAVVRH